MPSIKSRKSQSVKPQTESQPTIQPVAGIVPLLTAEQVATLLGISPLTVVRMAKAGRLPALRIGKSWRYRAAAISAWIQSQEQGAAA